MGVEQGRVGFLGPDAERVVPRRATFMDRVVLDSVSSNLTVAHRLPQADRSLLEWPLVSGASDEHRILRDFHNFDRDLLSANVSVNGRDVIGLDERYYVKSRALLRTHAEEIKRSGRFGVFSSMADILVRERQRLGELSYKVLLNDLVSLYLAVCQERFFVGIREGRPLFKRVDLPDPAAWPDGYIFNVGSAFLGNTQLVGRQELEIVPSRVVLPEELSGVVLPEPSRKVGDLLEEAFYRPRYIVPPEGAEVRFQRAGDLERAVVFCSRGKVIGKLVAGGVESFVWIDLDTAKGFSSVDAIFDIRVMQEGKSRWVNIFAEVYHDLVTAVESPGSKRKRGGMASFSKASELVVSEGGPSVIYIPRVIRKGEAPRSRLPYEGPPRPITPHRVVGHLRQRAMTEEHRGILRLWQEARGLDILSMVPEGHTFVRPYTVPADDPEAFRKLPQFIKRRIETRLKDDFERALAS